MLKLEDKVYFIKSSEDNIDLPYNKELTIHHIYSKYNAIGTEKSTIIIMNNDDYYPYQFILSKDYRKEKLKKLEEIMKNA